MGFWGLNGKRNTFSEKTGVLVGSDSELIKEAMMPNLGHVFPVVDDSVLNRIVQFKNSLLCDGLFSNISFLAVHADHD